MQMIIAYDGSPEDYVREGAHRRIKRPEACPNCGKTSGILALCYYDRWVTCSDLRRLMMIKVRRFICPACRVTTSMLPDFALTYRLVETDTVDMFFAGYRSGKGVDLWAMRLAVYQERFENQMPHTRRIVSDVYGQPALPTTAVDLWGELCQHFGGARKLAARLAAEAGITVFGTYRCHHPPREPDLHTTQIFPGERIFPFSTSGHDNGSDDGVPL